MLYGLKKVRDEKGLTQSEMAELLGVPRDTITNLETGRVKSISFELGIKLLAAGYSLDEIFKNSSKEDSGVAA